MPSSDLVLDVRQIANYPTATSTTNGDLVLIQRGGLGGPYAAIPTNDLVGKALAQSGDMVVAGALSAFAVQSGSGHFSNLTTGLFDAQQATIFQADFTVATIGCVPIATQGWVNDALAQVSANTVWRFNERTGDVHLTLNDITWAGGAPIVSPFFGGEPQAPTPLPQDSSNRIATTAWVMNNAIVSSFNGRIGAIELLPIDIASAGGAFLADPIFTGNPQAPTPAPGDNSNSIATTAYVTGAIGALDFAPIDSPQFTGQPSGPTAAPGTDTGQLATTAFVMNAVAASVAGVATFNGRAGHVTLVNTDIVSAGGALLVSPTFTGTPQAPTAAPATNTTQIATTAFVTAAVGSIVGAGVSSFNTRTGAVTLAASDLTAVGGALLASPALTGVPTAPTATAGTNTTQIATTAYVLAAISAGGVVASFNGRTGAVTLSSADISAAGGALTASPSFTGVPVAPTAASGVSTTQIATTAFVQAAILSGTAGVSSFNTRTGAVVLAAADVTGVGGALLASPAFTGVPTAPTAAVNTSTTQLATTAFVTAQIASTGVSSFNTRTGAVTLSAADLSSAGGALLASPTFTGTPSAPTATAGTSSTQLATTAFVAAALTAAGGVTTFNGRGGAVTLTSADITGAGGAILASPAFTGSPTAPTATAGTNTTQVATTAFVTAAIAAYTPTGFLSTTTGGTVSGPVDLKVQAVTAAASTSINRASGENVTLTLGVSITTLTISGWAASGFTGKVRLVIVSSGAFTIAWPAGTKWAGGTAPTLTSSGTDIVILMSDNAGTTIYGSVVGQGYA